MSSLADRFDQKLKPAISVLRTLRRPRTGWIRAVRDALGLTQAQLAGRMELSQPRIVKMEQAEADGSLSMRNLDRAAAALGCRVIYVFVPDRPLAEVIHERAEKIIEKQMTSGGLATSFVEQSADEKARHREAVRQHLMTHLTRNRGALWQDD